MKYSSYEILINVHQATILDNAIFANDAKLKMQMGVLT